MEMDRWIPDLVEGLVGLIRQRLRLRASSVVVVVLLLLEHRNRTSPTHTLRPAPTVRLSAR